MRWLYLYLTHDPRGASSSTARPTRSDATYLPPIRPGTFARWAAAPEPGPALPGSQPLTPPARPARLRLADQLR